MQRGQIVIQTGKGLFFFLLQKLFFIHAHSVGAISVISYQHAQVPRPLNTENNPNTQRE